MTLSRNTIRRSWFCGAVRAVLVTAVLVAGAYTPTASARSAFPAHSPIAPDEATAAPDDYPGLPYLQTQENGVNNGEGEGEDEPAPEPLPAPILRVPEDGAVIYGSEVTVRWYMVPDADDYHVQFAHDVEFSMVLENVTAADTLYTHKELTQDNSTIFWRVRAEAKDRLDSPWSETRYFVSAAPDVPPPAPLLNRPADGEVVEGDALRLRWFIVESASRYTIELAYDAAFTMIDRVDMTAETSIDISELPQDESRLYWRVRAETENGLVGPWSETRSFISALAETIEGEGEATEGEGEEPLPPPLLDKPEDGEEIDSAKTTLRWFLVEGAESYQLQVARDEEFSKIEEDKILSTNTHELTDLPRDCTVFYWHVRAHQLYTGIWSETRSFKSVAVAPTDDCGCAGAWIEEQPWGTYSAIGGVVLLALSILWVAEGGGGPCMVATAAYGTPMAGQINVLRQFRDQVLLNSYAGTALVDVYYRNGEGLATYIASRPHLAALTRLLLIPALLASMAVLWFPEVVFGGFGGLLLLICALVWLRHKRRVRRLEFSRLSAHRAHK